MKVIGVIGLNGSGKDELIRYLHDRCDIHVMASGDIVREIAEGRGVTPSRKNLHKISHDYMIRFGEDYFVSILAERISQNDWEGVGITGIRTPEDVQLLRDRFGPEFLLIKVEVSDPYLRYHRIRQRAEARNPEGFDRFLEQDREEREMFRLEDAMRESDFTINNDRNLEFFHKEIDEELIDNVLSADLSCG
jgi:dephospho-CoA kinase